MMINLFDVVDSCREINPDLVVTTLIPSSRLTEFTPRQREGCAQFSDMYVFGDSLSDLGNAFDAVQKATGEGRPPSPPYFQGRFCNDFVWVEYLATSLGLTSGRKTNFAVGGATTGRNNAFIPNNPLGLPGLRQQIDSFVENLKVANQQADPNALYTVWAGANDYVSDDVTHPAVPIENLSYAVTSLAGVGAKNIIVPNLPDLGEVPAARNDSQMSTFLKALTRDHNNGLAEQLNVLSRTLSQDVNIILFDVYSVFHQVITNPAQFGFTNVTDSQLEQAANRQGNTGKFFFWDALHPTTDVHMILAKLALSLLVPSDEVELSIEQLSWSQL
jgi:phospholipase/lecithinase/hemolysin